MPKVRREKMKNSREETEMKRMKRSKCRIELVIGFACIGATVVFGI